VTAAERDYPPPSIYDILATPGTAAVGDLLQRLARRFVVGGKTRRWLEPACGTGRFLRLFAGRGLAVAGFDADPEMVAYARARLARRGLLRRARVFTADMADFGPRVAPASFDVAFNVDNTLRHLAGDAALQAHFAQIQSALRPGGVYIVGLSLSDYAADFPEEDVWRAARGACRVTQVVNYLPPAGGGGARRERVLSHLVVERPGGAQHADHAYDLRCYDEVQWRTAVARSPLRLLAGLDANGNPREDRRLPYQIDVLGRVG